jgi:hypothetical protein
LQARPTRLLPALRSNIAGVVSPKTLRLAGKRPS